MAFVGDHKGQKIDQEASKTWYHGSPKQLTHLRVGSSITRNRDLAVAFSHKPSQLGVDDQGQISHNGQMDGYLYEVVGVQAEGIYVHPACESDDPWEWLIKEAYQVILIETTQVKKG